MRLRRQLLLLWRLLGLWLQRRRRDFLFYLLLPNGCFLLLQ